MTRKRKLPKFVATMMAVILMFTTLGSSMLQAAADSQDQTGNADIVRSATISYEMNGSSTAIPLTSNVTLNGNQVNKFFLALNFALVDDLEAAQPRTLRAGDYYLFDLPDSFKIIGAGTGDVRDAENEVIATYQVLANAVKITFTDYVEDPDVFEIVGRIALEFSLDMSKIAVGTKKDYSMPLGGGKPPVTLTIENPSPSATKPTGIAKTAKSYNETTHRIAWEVTLSPADGTFESCVFTDKLDLTTQQLISIKHGTTTLKADEYELTGSNLTYTIPKGRNGSNFRTITIETEVKAGVFLNNSTVIENDATLTGGASDVNLSLATPATKTILPEWLKKSGTPFGGNKIRWTLTVNSNRINIFNGIVTDILSNELVLDPASVRIGTNSTSAGSTVSAYATNYATSNKTEIYAVYTAISGGRTDLKIYLPRDAANARSDYYTITFETSIANKSSDDSAKTYENTASMTCDFVGGPGEGPYTLVLPDIGSSGVSVPALAVTKGYKAFDAAHKRDGRITWTIETASNVTAYGPSQIIDTLPDGLSYIAGQVYHENTNTYLTSTTEPKAIISGNELVITFSGNNAFSAQQKFTVGTKIDADKYDKNLAGKTFTNTVKSTIYKTGTALTALTADNQLATKTAQSTISIDNTIIAKAALPYAGNVSNQGENPRVDFQITLNSNKMPLSNLTVTDDLSNIVTEFKGTADSGFTKIDGVKWSYVAGSLTANGSNTVDNISYDAGTRLLSFKLNGGGTVDDTVTVRFTAELDITQPLTPAQENIFRTNGVIRCKDNSATVAGTGLSVPVVSAPSAASHNIGNTMLGKSGTSNMDDGQILWTINLNQHKADLPSMHVIDVLAKGLTLDPTSIKLYSHVIAPSGEFVAPADAASATSVAFNYTYTPSETETGKYVLDVELPQNNTAYILQFATDVEKALWGQTINNSANFKGAEAGLSDDSSGSVKLADSSSGSSTKKTSIEVKKLDADNNQPLTGATFRLNWVKSATEIIHVRDLTVTDATTGSVTFSGLDRALDYTVTEIAAPNGYLIDDTAAREVDLPATGKAAPVVFTDSKTKTGSWTPEAVKYLIGKDFFRKFDFSLLMNKGGSIGFEEIMTGKSTDTIFSTGRTITFTPSGPGSDAGILSFSNAHIFTGAETEYVVATREFIMKEVTTTVLGGYTLDTLERKLNVTVTNVKGDSNLQVKITDENDVLLTDNYGNWLTGSIPAFTNRYAATGNINLSAAKTLTGRALEAEQFEFELYEQGNGTPIETVKNNVSGAVTFDNLRFGVEDVGTKTYIIKEKMPSPIPSGYTYDDSAYTITVSIDDSADNGLLDVQITDITKTKGGSNLGSVGTNLNAVVFENVYATSGVTSTISAKKQVSKHALANGQFTFVLTATDAAGTPTGTIDTVQNNGTGSITFGALSFQQSDIGKTYYYKVTETNDNQAGYTYDTTVYTVEIAITDNADGTLTATQTIRNGAELVIGVPTFTNVYAADGQIELNVLKSLTGHALAEDQFSFILKQNDVELQTKTNAEGVLTGDAFNGTVAFDALTYDIDDLGDKTYVISEDVTPAAPGYTYDNAVYTITVNVSDNHDGTLTAAVTNIVKTLEGEDTSISAMEDVIFENQYITSDITSALAVKKVLTGRTLADEQFSFTLSSTDADGDDVQEIETVKNLNDIAAFTPLVFTQADIGKTYYYQVTEVNDRAAGYTYDAGTFAVKIEITDNHDGTLTATQIALDADADVDGFVFYNDYKAEGTVEVKVSTTLTGKGLQSDQFVFYMQRLEDGKPVGEKLMAYNDGKGNIVFPGVKFTQDDVGKKFVYALTELDAGETGYTYDAAQYTVEFTVADNGDGTLEIGTSMFRTLNGKTEEVSELIFENEYKEPVPVPKTGVAGSELLMVIIMLATGMVTLAAAKKRKATVK